MTSNPFIMNLIENTSMIVLWKWVCGVGTIMELVKCSIKFVQATKLVSATVGCTDSVHDNSLLVWGDVQ
jgi:hypothetical protein